MMAFLEGNVGPWDEAVRFFAGFVLLFLAGTHVIGPWGYLGVVPLATAMLGYCPLYHALGICTGPA